MTRHSPREQDGEKSEKFALQIGARARNDHSCCGDSQTGTAELGIRRTANFVDVTKQPARRGSGDDGWMLELRARGWSRAARARTVRKLKVRGGIILGPHPSRTFSKLDLGMQAGTGAHSTLRRAGARISRTIGERWCRGRPTNWPANIGNWWHAGSHASRLYKIRLRGGRRA